MTAMAAPLANAQYIPTPRVKPAASISFDTPTSIGLARVDQGRLIVAPFEELRSWAALSMRFEGAATLFPVSPTSLNSVSAEFAEGGQESSNRIDEIRLAAALQGQNFVLIYGEGVDANAGMIGGQKYEYSGLSNTVNLPKAQIKGALVGTYTGRIYGVISTNENANPLADFMKKAQTLIGNIDPDAEGRMTS